MWSHLAAFATGALVYQQWENYQVHAQHRRLLQIYCDELYALNRDSLTDSPSKRKRYLQLSDWMMLPHAVAIYIQPEELEARETE